jgi:hypothetical protein
MTHWLLLMFAALPLLAQAQAESPAVWRCGADGRSFSDVPCAGGRLVEVPAPRSPADVAAAQAQADQEKRMAERLQRERQQRESVTPGTGLMGIKHAKVVQLSATPTLTKKAKAKRQAKGQAKRPRYVAVALPA